MTYLIAFEGLTKDKGYRASGNYVERGDGKITEKTICSWKDDIQNYADLKSWPTILNILKLEDEE